MSVSHRFFSYDAVSHPGVIYEQTVWVRKLRELVHITPILGSRF